MGQLKLKHSSYYKYNHLTWFVYYCRREETDVARAIALSLAESEKSSSKSSKKDDTINSQVPTNVTASPNPPPGFKKKCTDPPPGLKKRSDDPTEPQESTLLIPAPDPPPGFKKKPSNYEKDFPVMIKAPESLPSLPSLSYGNLINDNAMKQDFPVFSTIDNKAVVPPPGLGKNSTATNPLPEKKESIVKRLRDILGSDEKFEQLKMWSSKYRMNEISAEEYENNCYSLFGDQQWSNVFDELVATFPDKQGQDDLIKAHQRRNTKPPKKSRAKRHNHYRPFTAWGTGNSMVGDRMDDDLYPPLPSTAMLPPPPAKWNHKVAVK